MTVPGPTGPAGAPTVSRRAVVVGGAVASAAVLAACSSGSSGSSTPAGGSTTGTPGTGGSGGGAGVLGPVSQVPVGGGAIFAAGDQKFVVTQPTAGQFVGFSAVCPHQGCTCNQVADGFSTARATAASSRWPPAMSSRGLPPGVSPRCR